MSSNRKSSRKKTVGRKPVRSSKKPSKTKYVNNYIKNPFKGIVECHKLIKNKKKRLYEEMMNSNPRSLRVLRGLVVPKPNEFKNRYDKYIIYYNEIDRIMNLIESNRISKSDLYRDKVSLTSLIVNANKSRIKLLELDPELDRQVTICSKSLHK